MSATAELAVPPSDIISVPADTIAVPSWAVPDADVVTAPAGSEQTMPDQGPRSPLLRRIAAIDSITARTGNEVLGKLTYSQFDLVRTALERLKFKTPLDAAFDRSDIAQEAISSFSRNYNMERFERTGEWVVFPFPTMRILITITNRRAVSTYRHITSRAPVLRGLEDSFLEYARECRDPDFSDDLFQPTDIRQLIEAVAGDHIPLSPLEQALMKRICTGEKINANELAELFGSTPVNVRVAKHRMLARLRKSALPDSVIATYRPRGIAK